MVLEETSEEIKKLNAQIKELEKQKQKVEMMDIYKQTAIDLHSLCCTGAPCEWNSEEHNNIDIWKRKIHEYYLNKARTFVNKGLKLSTIRDMKEIGFRISV